MRVERVGWPGAVGLASVLACGAACGSVKTGSGVTPDGGGPGGDDATVDFASGTRLRAQYLDGRYALLSAPLDFGVFPTLGERTE